MRYLIKYIIRYLRLGRLVRLLRSFFYWSFDILGEAIFLLLRTCHLLPWREEFNNKSVEKILIIRIDRIGDVILSTPAIRAVRSTFPKADVHLLMSEYTEDLVISNHNIDRLLIYKKDKLNNSYDLAIALHPGLRQNYLTYISGAKFRVGYTGQGGGFFLTSKIKDDRATRIRHEVESALEIVGAVGCKIEDKSLEISITEEGEKFAEGFFKQNNLSINGLIITIHPGARQSYVRWNKEGFAAVADDLIKNNKAKIILTGSREEDELVKSIVYLMKERPTLAIGLRLRNLVSLIKRANLFIGNCTGPMHIAAALEIPIVAIFGSVPLDSYNEWCPWGEGHIIVSKKLNCVNCHPSDCFDYKCLRLITPQEVLKVAREQIQKIKSG